MIKSYMKDSQPKHHLTQNHANDLAAYYCDILRGSLPLQDIPLTIV